MKPSDRFRPPTLRQVAEKAGVSIATASYVVSGRPRSIHPETVRKVWDAVRALGYVPQASARRLKGIATRTLGVIFPHEVASLGTSPFFGQLLDGIVDVATEARYSVMLFTGLSWIQAEQGYTAYVDGRCDGHVLIAPSSAPELVAQISGHGVPMVVVAAMSGVAGVPSFCSDNQAAAHEAVRHLHARGHQRIAHVAGTASSTDAQEREQGYREAMAELGLTVRPEWVFRGGFQIPGGMAAVDFWATLPAYLRPTAVFSSSDDMSLGLLEGARHHGLRVPEDLSIVSFDDVAAAQAEVPLTSFSQSLRDMGREATTSLIAQVEGRPVRDAVFRFPTPLVERASCSPLADLPGPTGRRSTQI